MLSKNFLVFSQNSFKKSYRARFCHGGGSKIDVRPGQNVLKVIQDCFESCGRDLAIRSPSTTCCSTPIDRNERKTFLQSRRPKAGLTDAVERACNSVVSLHVSPLETATDRGWSHESSLKPAINDCIADSKKGESPVPKGKTNNILKDAEAPCKIPLMFSDPEDDHGSVGSPPVEELKSSPALLLLLDDQNSPAAVKRHVEVENVEAPQTGREKQVTLVQGTEHIATSSVQKEKSFSAVVLEAVATGALGKRYSATTSPSSPPPVKDQDTEIENECEFLIDESDSESSNWFSIPQKNKKSRKDGSATLVSQAQPSENEKTESKKGKNRKVQVEALTKRKTDDLDVTAYDFRGTSESDLVSNSKGNVPKFQRQNSTPMGKTKKDTVRHGSANQKKDMSHEPEDEELLLSWSGLETQASDTEQHKTRVKPSEDLPMPSDGHQQEETVSQKKNLQSSKQVASKAPQHLVHKKQTAKQKLRKDTVAKTLVESPRKNLKKSVKKHSNKKPHLKREESSDSDPGEEEFEREPVKLNEVFTSPLHQKLESSVIQKLPKSKRRSCLKPKNLLRPLESLGGANYKTPEKALQHLIDCVKNSERKQLSAESSEKIPKKINCQTSKGVSSKPEDTESQVDSDSSSVQDVARKKQKLPDVEMRSNKRKRNTQHKLQFSFAAEKPKSDKSGPVLEHCDKQASRRKSCEQDSTSSGNSEDLSYQMRDMFSNSISRHKIVLPSNTPNVRRTKRVRLKPLEYWRGERVNYRMMPSGELVVSGIVCPEKEPYRKFKQRKRGHKQKRDEPRNEIPANLGHTLVDKSKPAIVVDVETNQEIFLVCVNTESSHSCFFRDESIEIYKNLNTSDFSTGRLILKPLKQKGHQFVHLDTIAFHVIHGKIIVTLHKTSYCLSTGDFFYVPAGNGYNIYNLLNEDSVLLFTQLKRDS
ncbi:centromere protein C isoform X1 [Apus apus]|uniref:centromere protein C isoform X1 n=1 Tax=Apus apus TaxID=8895 RepID=UPI0021F8C118|nr:centromere protein C isoform X1 [Apus apus]